MEGTALLGRLNWQVCDVVDAVWETRTARSLILDAPDWPGHLPGQHVDVRLTAEDGYQAERSYSLAQPVAGRRIGLTIQRLPDGEVSPYLCDELRPGDQLELRGPIGGYFVWKDRERAPVLLVAGGSGIVPLWAILTARSRLGLPTRLLVSARSQADLIYAPAMEELAAGQTGLGLFTTLTREQPAAWRGYSRRIDREMLREVAWPVGSAPEDGAGDGAGPLTFVCGPTGFVEAAADILVGLGHPPASIRTERFGPTGV